MGAVLLRNMANLNGPCQDEGLIGLVYQRRENHPQATAMRGVCADAVTVRPSGPHLERGQKIGHAPDQKVPPRVPYPIEEPSLIHYSNTFCHYPTPNSAHLQNSFTPVLFNYVKELEFDRQITQEDRSEDDPVLGEHLPPEQQPHSGYPYHCSEVEEQLVWGTRSSRSVSCC